ncbi:MAG: ATP-dependent DNA helicase RecG [Planctomycetota bacterium]|nr:MAG: ATP-dependent DNA helicase RecG [Planctomycetota bacterium]
MSSIETTSVQYVKGVGPKRCKDLVALGVQTVLDLLYHFPRKYLDRSDVTPIDEVVYGEMAVVRGKVTDARMRYGRRMPVFKVMIDDGTSIIKATFFNQPWVADKLTIGTDVLLAGKVEGPDHALELKSPEYALIEEDSEALELGRIVPYYPLTGKLNQKWLRKVMRNCLDKFADELEEFYTDAFLAENRLPAIGEAIRQIHFPETAEEKDRALRRFKFDEFFFMELALAVRRRRLRKKTGPVFKLWPKLDARIRELFPFTLTEFQDDVLKEIVADLRSPYPMNRLLQGDVGSGKTLVAAYAMLVAVGNEHQAAIMAPTEILAEQHFQTFSSILADAKVSIVHLAGGDTKKNREEKLAGIETGKVDIVIGTHAIIQSDVQFRKLGLVVVDEQHKFGVMQRKALTDKTTVPNVLVMTATPIPRTLALTVYGDLDVSTIRGMPPGRRPVETSWIPPAKNGDAWEFIRGQIEEGKQGYVVYPVISDSEKLGLQGAEESFEYLSEKVLPDVPMALLHGRMKKSEKETVMQAFRDGEYGLLVATQLIEVGVDVSNAAVMVVMHSERFGLAQLHQLRGRVGRGAQQSYCFLFSDTRSRDAGRRLSAMERTTDGFKIAEEDLKIRGPGEFFGTSQHGLPELAVADLVVDYPLLRAARDRAFKIIDEDADLSKPENTKLKTVMETQYRKRLELMDVG